MKIFLGVAAGVVAGIGFLHLRYVQAPAPAEVCQHILDITVAEAGEQAMDAHTQDTLLDRLRLQCIQHKRDKIQLRGKIEYARYAKCVIAATALADIEAC